MAKDSEKKFDLVKIGALWLREAKSGLKYMSGIIKTPEELQITVFKNRNKKKENHPDYEIFVRAQENPPKKESKDDDKKESKDDDKKESRDDDLISF